MLKKFLVVLFIASIIITSIGCAVVSIDHCDCSCHDCEYCDCKDEDSYFDRFGDKDY